MQKKLVCRIVYCVPRVWLYIYTAHGSINWLRVPRYRYILAHILRRRIFKEINQSETPVMDAIGKRLEGVFPSYG